jgi:hypothetical protein
MIPRLRLRACRECFGSFVLGPKTRRHWRMEVMSHIMHFDHVGITVADLDSVTAFFADLGLEQRAGSAQHLFRGRRPPGGRRRPACERIRTGRRHRSAREHLADGPCARAGGNRRLADRADRLTPSGCPLPMRHFAAITPRSASPGHGSVYRICVCVVHRIRRAQPALGPSVGLGGRHTVLRVPSGAG